MPKSHTSTSPRRDKELSFKNGLIFYSIIALSILLPFVVALCIVFMDIFVTVLVSTVFLSLLVWLVLLYRRLQRQLDEFCEVIETGKLLEGNHEIRILGGLFSIRIEEKQPLLPAGESQDHPVELLEDQGTDRDRV